MPTFAYQARDRAGQRVAGTRDAPDQRAALEELRAIGLFVTQLAPASRAARTRARRGQAAAPSRQEAVPATVPPSELRSELQSVEVPQGTPLEQPRPAEAAAMPVERSGVRESPGLAEAASGTPLVALPRPTTTGVATQPWLRANAKEMALFYRQMNAMLNAGTSVSQALATLGSCAANPALRRACGEMSARTAAGQPWSETVTAYPGLFSKLSIGMISAGEMGGYLDRICARLADYAERDYNLQQSIKRETWYPKLLVFCSILIPSVVPLVVGMVQGQGLARALLSWFLFVVKPLTLVGVVWGGWKLFNYLSPVALHSGSPREVIDGIKLRLPLIGKTARSLALAKFCRALGALYAAGMGLNRTLNLAADTCGNLAMARAVRRIIPRVEQGEPLSECLAATGQFSPIVLQMLRTGEMSGAIDVQLDKVADFLENDAETTIKQSVKVLGVVVFLLIAIYIGSQVISFWTGYYNSIMDTPELSGG